MSSCLLLLVFFLSTLSTAHGGTNEVKAGQCIATVGNVQAGENLTLKQGRTLRRGSEIYMTDMIETGEEAKAQLKFIDGGLITVAANTIYRVSSYSFTQEKSEVILELVKGGFRAMTGTIGKEYPNDYRVKTSVGTIGVRGTIFSVFYDAAKRELAVQAEMGQIIVTNLKGEKITVSQGENITVTATSTSTPSTTPSPLLSSVDFSTPLGGESLEAAQAAINAQPIVPPSAAQMATAAAAPPPAPLMQQTIGGMIIELPEDVGNPCPGI